MNYDRFHYAVLAVMSDESYIVMSTVYDVMCKEGACLRECILTIEDLLPVVKLSKISLWAV